MARADIQAISRGNLFSLANKSVNTINTDKRLPALILTDTSGSMEPHEALLKRSVEDLYDKLLDDDRSRSAAELAVMTFNSDIEILESMREIALQESRGRNLNFRCAGPTLTGLAVKAALLHIKDRINTYKSQVPKIKYYPPIMFILSDGRPYCSDPSIKAQDDEALKESLSIIANEVASNNLVVVAVEIGDHCNHDLMRRLTGLNDDRHVMKVNDGTELKKFFEITSSIIIKSSRSGTKKYNDMSVDDIIG